MRKYSRPAEGVKSRCQDQDVKVNLRAVVHLDALLVEPFRRRLFRVHHVDPRLVNHLVVVDLQGWPLREDPVGHLLRW